MGDKLLDWFFLINKKGEFVWLLLFFCDWVIVDGLSGFLVEVNCYYFYVFLVCFWVYCILIVWKLKGLENVIFYIVVDWFFGFEGWLFIDSKLKCILDILNGC